MIDFDNDWNGWAFDRVWYLIMFGFGPGKGNGWFDFPESGRIGGKL